MCFDATSFDGLPTADEKRLADPENNILKLIANKIENAV
jgi:hypothetical protein